MSDTEHAGRGHAQSHSSHGEPASTDAPDVGHMSASLAAKRHGKSTPPQPDLVRTIVSAEKDGENTRLTIRKQPDDIVMPATDPLGRAGYVEGILDAQFWVLDVTADTVVAIVNGQEPERFTGLYSAVLNATRLPSAGDPAAVKGEKTLTADTRARLINYQIDGGKQFVLMLQLGSEAGVHAGMLGQLHYSKLDSFYTHGHFVVERVLPTACLVRLELSEQAGPLDYVKNVILECEGVIFAPANQEAAKAKSASGSHRRH